MEAKQIIQADFLDLLFDGRNKKYGAYTLRKNYSRRLWTAVAVTLLFSFSGFWLLQSGGEKNVVQMLETREIVLSSLEVMTTPPPPPPPLPALEKQASKNPIKAVKPLTTKPKIVSSEIKRTKFTTPIVKDKVTLVPVPTVDEIAVVDNITVDGVVGYQDFAPASPSVDVFETDKGSGIAEVLAKPKEDKNKIFKKVEIQASVNIAMWRQHLEQNLVRHIEDAVYAGMQPGTYTVRVRFLVETDGSINDVSALNDPGFGLAQGATQVVKSGPKWNPGEQNGRKVRSYHTQPITFVIMDS